MNLKEETETLRKELTLKLKSQEEISNDLKINYGIGISIEIKDEEATALQKESKRYNLTRKLNKLKKAR